ncbi:dTDP-4-dehydrorhamnose 3,5-epimerase family protein [Cellulosimicrobium marinum]|uniref:dTDP-4-dehydrorhamnose 3,5-epimerase family protein n=1 Tax=Cellulosimicrobium marinum TaxID=1638992 RepID=UPI001E5006F9|nr:dTDP-4-dehydrorhamnose 3,5-epimerase [Cellulosimicrobium marinum]MCB7137176.1 dTDP-4-dehydrorhamnose 3,5-epimerase [Cellulosimicrobium marinum]
MDVRELTVPGAWELTPRQFPDDRGVFLEWFTARALQDATGRRLELAQANASTSRAGVVRGIHYADVPPGQAKYVTCVSGSVLDVVVDLRVGSPTFGRWDAVTLDTRTRRAIFLSEGLGHGFMALEDGSTVVYLCSTGYAPEREHGVDPRDPELAITWPTRGPGGVPLVPSFSEKDASAPSLADARAREALPDWDRVRSFVEALQV